MPLTQKLSLEKNLAILFKSPPELNIGKQYPVRLKRCLAFCGLDHFMAYRRKYPKLFYLTDSSSSTNDKDSVTEETKENQQTNTAGSQANDEELRPSKDPICSKEDYGDIMASFSSQPQVNEENKDNQGTFNTAESSLVAESQVDTEISTKKRQLINKELDPEVKQLRKRSRSPKEPERFKATQNDSGLTIKRSELKATQSPCKNSSENSQSILSKSGENHKVKTKQTPIYFSIGKTKERKSKKKLNVDLDAATSSGSHEDIEDSMLSNNGFHSLDFIITPKEPQTPCNGHFESKFDSQVRNGKEIPRLSSKITCYAGRVLEHTCERTPNVDTALSEVAVDSQIFTAKSSDITFKLGWPKVLVDNAPDSTDRINQSNKIEPQANKGELQIIKEPIRITALYGDVKTPANDRPEINRECNNPEEILNFIEPSAVAESQVNNEPLMDKEQLGDKKSISKAKQTRKRDRSSKEANKAKITLNNSEAIVKRLKTEGTQADRRRDQSTEHLDIRKVDLNCDRSASKGGKIEGIQSSGKKSQEKLTTRPSKSGDNRKSKREQIPECPSLTKSNTCKGKKLPKLLKVYLDDISSNESDEGDENTMPIKCRFYISRRFSKKTPTIVEGSRTPPKEQFDWRLDRKFDCEKETKRHSSMIKTCPECAKQHICNGSKVENDPQISKISSLDDLLEWDCKQNQEMLIENAPNSKVASLLHNAFELKKQNKKLQNKVTRLREKEAFYERFNESISKTLESMEHYKAAMEGDSPPIIISSRMKKRVPFEKTLTVKQDQPPSTGHTQLIPNQTPIEIQLKLSETGGVINAGITSNGHLSLPIEFVPVLESSSLIKNKMSETEASKWPSLSEYR
ncbi:unnamed protein product [Hymenolepis diminuta]|uniref:Fanconi anemia group M protein n=1 Tax=Hymenolepis diminuta TaxID=6216 RepID=A0A0R3SEI4_HYMDI|nr:unnamed protein product [Hymenolepis diminuta]VUZ54412.1 unnamed protein product [Hymenolepis diminuta]